MGACPELVEASGIPVLRPHHSPCGSDIPVRQRISTDHVEPELVEGSDIPVRQRISTDRVGRTFLSDKKAPPRPPKQSSWKNVQSCEPRVPWKSGPLELALSVAEGAASKWFDSEKRALARQRTLQHVREGHDFSRAE